MCENLLQISYSSIFMSIFKKIKFYNSIFVRWRFCNYIAKEYMKARNTQEQDRGLHLNKLKECGEVKNLGSIFFDNWWYRTTIMSKMSLKMWYMLGFTKWSSVRYCFSYTNAKTNTSVISKKIEIIANSYVFLKV